MSNTSLLELRSNHIDLTGFIQNLSVDPLIWRGFSDLYPGDLVVSGTSRKVVVKVSRALAGGKYNISRAIKLLNQEVAIVGHLNHPNITEYLGFVYHLGHRPAIVMARYPRGDASTYLANRSIDERLHLIGGMIEGLCYLHSRSPAIVHGDIKGVNILVNDSGKGVLSDFGLSRVAESVDESLGVNGTIRWMAPELFRGEPEAAVSPTLSSDVWTLGCTFYELLLGTIPYAARRYYWMVIKDILQGALSFSNDNVTREGLRKVWMIIRECWSPMSRNRPSMFELKAKLDTLCLLWEVGGH